MTASQWAAGLLVARRGVAPCNRTSCGVLGCGKCLTAAPVEVAPGDVFERAHEDGRVTEVTISQVDGDIVRGHQRDPSLRRVFPPGWWTTLWALGLPFYRRKP